MKNICWATDLHLPFAAPGSKFFDDANNSQGIIISGDISGGIDVKKQLKYLDEKINVPIYFVLGNHDFYHRTVKEVHDIVGNLNRKCKNLVWLNNVENGYVKIDHDIAIVGHEGWYDCQYGRFGSVALNDFIYIKDFKTPCITGVLNLLVEKFKELATNAANHVRKSLTVAFKKYNKVILVTHIPPFDKAAWHQGRLSDPTYLPLFSSKIMGDCLEEIMLLNQDKQLLVLCGHTHSPGEAKILDNLKVLTGRGEYYHPEIYKTLIDEDWIF